MSRAKRHLSSLGYVMGLLPPIFLWAGAQLGVPALAFFMLVCAFPLLRSVFGDAGPRVELHGEKTATALHHWPCLLAAAYIASFTALAFGVSDHSMSAWDFLAYGMSVWSVAMFGSCVAHELLHRREPVARMFGRALSGTILYPLLEHEHRLHHARPGDVSNAEWPLREETAWGFSMRRFKCSIESAFQGSRTGATLAGGIGMCELLFACMVSVALLVFLGASRGAAVVGVHVAAAVVLSWSLHIMTYVQHWGLAKAGSGALPMAWEDRCRVQAWLTLNLSFHQAHHEQPSRPYYRISPATLAPRAPAGYIVLFFCALFPRAWFALMNPVLDAWLADPACQRCVGRRLICFGGREGVSRQSDC